MFLPEQYLHKPVFFLTFPTKYQKNCNIKMMEIIRLCGNFLFSTFFSFLQC